MTMKQEHILLDFEEARSLVHNQEFSISEEHISLSEALGRYTAVDILAPMPHPSFTNSAMDGYVGTYEDFIAQKSMPVIETLYAKAQETEPLYIKGSVYRIMTGAAVPQWADCIVPIEQTKLLDDDRIVSLSQVKPMQHIREIGSDICLGDIILPKGACINSSKLACLAALGMTQIAVAKKPAVAILTTGDEISRDPGPLYRGQIYDSGFIFLSQKLKSLTYPAVDLGISPDAPDAIMERATSFFKRFQGQNALLISVGGVSAGDKDYIPLAADALEFKQVFHKVKMRPGKPIFLAQKGPHLWLGLPGNMISSMVGFALFAIPLLRRMQGERSGVHDCLYSRMGHGFEKPEAITCIYRGTMHQNGEVSLSGKQGSADLMPTLTGNCWVILKQGKEAFSQGDFVPIIPME